MLNEVMQWVAIVVIAVLVLGLLRQVARTLPLPARAASGGPPVGHKLPKAADLVVRTALGDHYSGEGAIVAFVTESCVACQRLISMAPDVMASLDGRALLIVAKNPSHRFRDALQGAGLVTVADETGEIWRTCKVVATPLVVSLDRHGHVMAKEVTHRVDKVASSVPPQASSRVSSRNS